ncbi:manganese efflux pump [Anaerobacillus sp. CMMVII]|nr:manganese efflux pump [Anaerobacillus sp. CMMVII]
MAFALGMDAFSLAIGMGMLGLRYKHIFKIGVTVGAFHVIMPFLGIVIGKFLTQYFGMVAIIIGGVLLVVLGLQMLYSALFSKEQEERILQPEGLGLLLFALSVSVDSFSVGLSLGMIGAKTLVTLLSFGLISMALSWLGLIIGKKVKGYIGVYGELLGGCILLGFGLKLLWPI